MLSYQNPVYPFYFADPFVWKYEGRYYAVGTGPVVPESRGKGSAMTSGQVQGHERAFPLLSSENFAEWHWVGGALEVPRFAKGADFWAPEVAFAQGLFYIYYSVSLQGLKHQLRVARGPVPQGPYADLGLLMEEPENCPFAIDPHPFLDDDGQWYLFYARDFLDMDAGLRAGTALVVDRLLDMTRLAGEERSILRARCDWQRFKADRPMYGSVFDWHTLEGPCVRKHDGRYYCFYSGGCYENESYGVDYGVADHVMGPYSDAGNEAGPRVLKTVANRVVGPGHNSIVLGPDGRTEYMAYHAWDEKMAARRMFLDKLVWTPQGPRCEGPTVTSQEIDPLPAKNVSR
jgi:beta-xylosidase